MKRRFIYLIAGLAMLLGQLSALSPLRAQEPVQFERPAIVMRGVESKFEITDPNRAEILSDTVMVSINGKAAPVILEKGKGEIPYDFPQKEEVAIIYDSTPLPSIPVNPVPLWLSILPPLIAILMAFITKEVYSSLFTGILVGAITIAYYNGGGFWAPIIAILDILDTYLIQTLADSGNASVIVFLMLIGSTVAIVSLNGGMKGLVKLLSKYAKTPRSGQLITFLMDLCIFFDDYANTLVVGSTMRPLAKDLRISKEKLSFIVDSTAAPVGALALITTWIGAELSYIEKGVELIGITDSPYSLFIASIPYRFYPILMLAFVLLIAISQRDYGPMLTAERRAHNPEAYPDVDGDVVHPDEIDSEIEPDPSIEGKWYNAVIPIGVLILVTIAGIFYTGYTADPSVWDSDASFGSRLMGVVGNADSYVALLWASISSTLVAIIITAAQKIMNFHQCMEAFMTGFKIMLPATIVLILAWTLAGMTGHLHTADFVASALIEWNVTPLLLPALTFALAGIIAFSTGTSWGTMAILYPLVLPVTWELTANAGYPLDESMHILLNVISCILAGAVFGDHCSPISDTTIMSSSSTGCNHIEHVRTQMPYALTVGGVSLVWIVLATLGIPTWLLLIAGIVVLALIVRFVGKPSRPPIEEMQAHAEAQKK